jgi:AcrR family transcriptional regulator
LHRGPEHSRIIINTFTKNVKETKRVADSAQGRGPGRPRGRTPRGLAAKERLYDIAVTLIAERGYEGTTLREVAKRARVSPGLLYRYFPSKRAVVVALYDELSAQYAARAANMKPGRWRDRFIFAAATSVDVLAPHRRTLAALTPVIVGDPDEGVFSPAGAASRQRVLNVFQQAVAGATDAPRPDVAAALGRLLYLAHLAILLWWLMDKSPRQYATGALFALLRRALPAAALTLRLATVRGFVIAGDQLFAEALLDGAASSPPAVK